MSPSSRAYQLLCDLYRKTLGRVWRKQQAMEHPPVTGRPVMAGAFGALESLEARMMLSNTGSLPWPSANCSLQWKYDSVASISKTNAANTGLTGTFFNSADLSGEEAAKRLDGSVNFDWDQSSPALGVNAQQFSARWLGRIAPDKSETYTFSVRSKGGVRLWIDNHLVIDDWSDTAAIQARRDSI